MPALIIVLRNNSVRKFSDEFSKYALQKDEFSKCVFQSGRVFFRTSFPYTEVNAAPQRWLRWRMVGSAGSPQVTIIPTPPSLVPAEGEPSVKTVSWPVRRRMVWSHVAAVSGGFMGAHLPSRNTFHCPLGAQGHSRSVWRASLEEMASGSLSIRAFVEECQFGRLSRLYRVDFYRGIR